MKLIETLKKFKSIEPDRDYTRKSRLLIVGENRLNGKSIFEFIFHNVQSGAAFALAVVALVLIFGGTSFWQALNPLKLSSLDPAGLKAEADAIDIQIELTKLNPYTSTSTSTPLLPKNHAGIASTTPQAASPATDKLKQEAKSLGIEIKGTNSSGSTDAAVTIDDALNALSE